MKKFKLLSYLLELFVFLRPSTPQSAGAAAVSIIRLRKCQLLFLDFRIVPSSSSSRQSLFDIVTMLEDSMDFGDLSAIFPPPNAESIKVLVRVRPVDSSLDTCIHLQSNQSLTVEDVDHKKTFSCSYDAILGPNASQAQVYEIVKDCTLSVLQGVNCTIFAYGQTGSGKVCTH